MARGATGAVRQWGLEWKPSSLELLQGVAVRDPCSALPLTGSAPGPPLAFTVVEELKLLGACLTRRGESRERLDHR
eukprot:6016254-Lingulodinium_polyedra.AAC.1